MCKVCYSEYQISLYFWWIKLVLKYRNSQAIMTRVIQFPRSISQCFTCCDSQDLSQVGSIQVPLGSHFRFYSAWDHNDNNKKGIWGFKLYEIMNNSSSIGIHYHLFFLLGILFSFNHNRFHCRCHFSSKPIFTSVK